MKKKTPAEVMDRALAQYKRARETGAEAMMELAFEKIKPLSGPVSVGIEAFEAIVLALIAEFPGEGYEAWQPPTDNQPGTANWKKMVGRIEQYWSDNTGSRD